MIYKFKSKAAGDVIMLGPQGDQLLRLLGREPAPQGIVEAGAIAAALQSLERALAQPAPGAQASGDDEGDDDGRDVGLQQRLWPFIELLKRSQAAGVDVVWGV